MTDNTKKRSREEQAYEAKEALLDAAIRLFAARGTAAVSLADIGRAAGFSRGLVNHHFGSREELMRRLAQRTQAEILEALAAFATQEVLPGAWVDQFVDLVERYFKSAREVEAYTRAYHVLRGAALPSEDPMRQAMAAGEAEARGYLEQVLRRGQLAGEVRADLDAADTAAWIIAMLRGVLGSQLLAGDGSLDGAERLCAQVVRELLTPVAGGAQSQPSS